MIKWPEIYDDYAKQTKIAYVSPAKTAAVALIPKCGSTSLTHATVGGAHLIETLKQQPVTHVFIRDPIERLESAYQFFREHAPSFQPSWQEFIDAVIDGEPNGHWQSQHVFIEKLRQPYYHKFEDIGQVWEDVTGKALPRYQSSQKVELPEYRYIDLKRHYRDDFNLREGV